MYKANTRHTARYQKGERERRDYKHYSVIVYKLQIMLLLLEIITKTLTIMNGGMEHARLIGKHTFDK